MGTYMMWIDNFRQFLDRAFQRIGEWSRGIEILPARLFRRSSTAIDKGQPALSGLRIGEVPLTMDAFDDSRHVELFYRFRSLHCHIRICILEPTPGMQFIYRAIQGSEEA